MSMAFFTAEERECFSQSTYRPPAKSITNRVFIARQLQALTKRIVPADISPNILAITSCLCLLQGWYICETYGAKFPVFSSLFLMLAVLAWFVLDEMDEYHAMEIGNNYNFVHLFDHVCSNVGQVFLATALARTVFGYAQCDDSAVWYVAQIIQLGVLTKHVQAVRTGVINYHPLFGPAEAVLVALAALAWRCVWPVVASTAQTEGVGVPTYVWALAMVDLAMHGALAFAAAQSLPSNTRTRNLLLLCVLVLHVPHLVQMAARYAFAWQVASSQSVMADALALSVVTCEIVLERLCQSKQRAFHPAVLVMCLVNAVSVPVSLVLSALYYSLLLFELSYHLRLPLFGVIRNVYVDGIFDMLHMGHLKHFDRAARLGTRLFVGVVNDEDATPYKRKPIMTSQERCDMVAASRSVYAVIPNAPCVKGGLDEAFLLKWNIHIVACGEEYEVEGDEWYGVPRRLGMTRVLPRTAMISTSDIIQRIVDREKEKGL